MQPISENIEVLGTKLTHPVLTGYQCKPCRDILTYGIFPSDFMTEAELNQKKRILERYQELMESKQTLPEGCSMP
jgi:hypothetical protein